jgi:hypothetical protein
MKKNVFCGIAACVIIAAVVAWNVSVNFSSQKNELSDISLANVVALAAGESGGSGKTITSCLGLWGPCSTASGATSKAPLVEVNL